MIEGYFTNRGRVGIPRVQAHVLLGGSTASEAASFVIDTGADRTHLSAEDARRLRFDYRTVHNVEISGVGGDVRVHRAQATLIFIDAGRFLYAFNLPLNVFPDTPEHGDPPSLLGRDVLNRLEMMYSPMRRGLQIEILAPDVRIAL